MRNFSGNRRPERKKDFSKRGGRDFGRVSERSSERHAMHRATCDNCGKDCEVPFMPTSGKPIYCSSCFEKNQNKDHKKYGYQRDERKNGGENRKREYNNENDQGSDKLRKEISVINKKLDKILEILNSELYNEAYDDFDEETNLPKPEKKTKKRNSRKVNNY